MTILEQMKAYGFTSDSPRDRAIRKLAEWEDAVEADSLGWPNPDELAEIRHELMLQPTGE